MITIGLENQAKQEEDVKKKICLEIRDITKADYPDESFDVIYSRDTLLHIGDKETLFANFYKWLKPGGKLLISDYCRGDQEHSDRFLKYVAQRGYHLLTVGDYGGVLSKVGFVNVDARDVTNYFVEILQKEMKEFTEQKESFIQEFSVEDYNDILSGWQDKVQRCSEGDQFGIEEINVLLGFFLMAVLQKSDCVYTSCYCEENIWHICKILRDRNHSLLGSSYAVFISNDMEAIPLWRQNAGNPDSDGLVIWDYHVIFVQSQPDGCWVYDLDSRLNFPCKFSEYQEKTFGDDNKLKPCYRRMFRVVPAKDYLEHFASDRRHMLKDGKWLKPPPSYPPIQTNQSEHNLHLYIKMSSQFEEVPGEVMNCQDLLQKFSN
nr:EOG090X0C0Q [Macrothrix elegans]